MIPVLPIWQAPLDAINVTSTGSGKAVELSPFSVGPVWVNGLRCENVENAWQYSKVYPSFTDIDDWREWRGDGYAKGRADRYPMGKGAIPSYTFLNGQKLGYVEARRKLYIPYYAAAVRTCEAWGWLWTTWAGKLDELILADFDAYDHQSLGYSWEDVINDEDRKMGHGFVLAMMLEGYV